ncbi:MAG: hypothetical protein ACJA0Y_002139 [Maricaulis maris]|jgi:hypothetical protein
MPGSRETVPGQAAIPATVLTSSLTTIIANGVVGCFVYKM